LKKAQEKMKRQANRERKEVEEWRKSSKVEYEKFGIQRKTDKETSGPICWSIYH